jgi:selenocysteine lyase/cysteine desulfurase
MSAVSYISSLLFDIEAIAKECQKYDIKYIVDLAHATGAV